ncbi:MAG: Acetolactate synthase small subunit [Alphaproteobacteria bacterium MarineAlpha9_Bin2]|nr:MAG: Acetolactate synthase small subunit [Alphaproteobacteria bacterium MarineAlpha9_Bin1]PPR31527.1 MAG: Acetolactate synthase small subunit [Alphaproteobacteria bacterium MarineAlpha9_Bin2]
MNDISTHTLSVIVDNKSGVLGRVVGMFTSRGYNIDSLTVAEVDEDRSLSRITLMVTVTSMVVDQIKAQLERIVPVRKVLDLNDIGDFVNRELILVKVKAKGERRVESLRVADIFRARVIDSSGQSFIFELTGSAEKLDAFINLMKPLGLVEVSRTGAVAILRGAKALYN